jgi:hypothetical protein
MRTTLALDDELVAKAQSFTGPKDRPDRQSPIVRGQVALRRRVAAAPSPIGPRPDSDRVAGSGTGRGSSRGVSFTSTSLALRVTVSSFFTWSPQPFLLSVRHLTKLTKIPTGQPIVG